jgi:hypothetical protein
VSLNLIDSPKYVGTTDEVKRALIKAAAAVAWSFDPTTSEIGVDVASNGIKAPVAGGTYEVIFTPEGQPNVKLPVTFKVNNGQAPVILFDEDPLVIKQQSGDEAHDMTVDELKVAMTVMDLEDKNLLGKTTAEPVGVSAINTHSIGVYKVHYAVSDTQGNTDTADRLVVVDDGRYDFIDENGDTKTDLIIGARNFVIERTRITGGEDQVRTRSFAEAYDNKTGARLQVALQGGIPEGWDNLLHPEDPTTYSFTWYAEGHENTTKNISGIASAADVIAPGGKDSSYALVANHFTVNVAEAAKLIAGGDGAFIAQAQVEAIPLVEGIDEVAPFVISRGDFAAVERPEPYPVRFGASDLTVTIDATVAQGAPPVLSVITPLVVWTGDENDPYRTEGSILPSEYSEMYAVTAQDAEDDDITGSVIVTADGAEVDLTQVGTYRLAYEVTDSDNNTKGARRVVVVNDGRYTIGKDRILLANGFVIDAASVKTGAGKDSTAQILSKSDATLIDAVTGDDLGSIQIQVSDFDGYGSTPVVARDHQITLSAPDPSFGTLVRTIVARVVAADTIDDGPKPHDRDKDTTYVSGTSIQVTTSEMRALIAGGDEAVLEALKVEASVARANGTLMSVDAKITGRDKELSEANGIYTLTVSDVFDQISINLTISVAQGNAPVIDAPRPLVVAISDDGDTLSREELLNGSYLPKTNTSWKVSASDKEEGDITTKIVITDPATGAFPVIPHNAVGVYAVTYSVTDVDGNEDRETRSLLIDDGTTIYDANYILLASSFLIANSEVDSTNATTQILERSGAQAYRTDGAKAAAYVVQYGDYAKRPQLTGYFDCQPLIGIVGYPNITKNITARIYGDGTEPEDGSGTNGAAYSLYAQSFRINITDALALQAKAATSAYESALIKSSKAESFSRTNSGLVTNGTVRLAKDGGFAQTSFEQPKLADGSANPAYPTRVPVTFTVDEEPATTVTIDAIVSNGSYPTLTVPAIKRIALGDVFGEVEHMAGVTAFDNENGNITSRVSYTSEVNTAKRGLYRVTYEVTDFEGNPASAIGFVAVGLSGSDDYVIDAFDFVKIADEVTGDDAEIVNASRARAWRIRTNNEAELDKLPVAVDAVVLNNGGWCAAVDAALGYKDYTVTLGVVPEAGYVFGADPSTTVTGRVIARDVTATDEDPKADVHYTIAANNAVIRAYEVAGYTGLDQVTKARLINQARAEAFKMSPALESSDVDVSANGITAGAKPGAKFDVTFVVKDMPSVAATVSFRVIAGSEPVLSVNGPLVMPLSPSSYVLFAEDLMSGVSAIDAEDGDLTKDIVVSGLGGERLPAIDTAVPGIYSVQYSVSDSDENTVVATRSVVVNDGRYELVDEDGDGDIDIIIGARNFVVNRSHVAETPAEMFAQAKALSGVEAYGANGVSLAGQLNAELPEGYRGKVLGAYPLVWTIADHPQASKSMTAEIIADDYTIVEVDKTSAYTLIARDFSVNSRVASNITEGSHFISRADARVIKLIDATADKTPVLVNNGGFKAAQAVYPITFGASGVEAAKLSVTISATVTNGTAPTLNSDSPIVIPIAPSGSPALETERLIRDGHIVAIDSEAIDAVNNPTGDITNFVQLTDAATSQAPSIAADQPGVYQLLIGVTDADDNYVERKTAVVIDDGTFVYGSGYILRAHDFDIELRDVAVSRSIEQIREQSEIQAWRNDGAQVTASVIDTGGYRDTAGQYYPVVGIQGPGNPDSSLSVTDSVSLSKPITANVIDTYARYKVTFDANGGTLVGPRVVTIIEPQTTLPYLPASPVRDGYTFRYWSTSPAGGTQFAADTPLTESITLYALWIAIPAVPAPAPQLPPTIIINNPPAVGGGTTYVQVDPGEATEAQTLPEKDAPLGPTGSGQSATPVEPATPATGWALFNLLAAILVLLLLVVFFIRFFFDRPKDEEYEEPFLDGKRWEAMTAEQRAQYRARREADYQLWLANQQRKETRQKVLFVNVPVLLIAGVALVEALIVLFSLQDFSLNMSIVDKYSTLFALIVFVQLLSPMVAAVIHNNKRGPQKTTPAPASAEDGSVTL